MNRIYVSSGLCRWVSSLAQTWPDTITVTGHRQQIVFGRGGRIRLRLRSEFCRDFNTPECLKVFRGMVLTLVDDVVTDKVEISRVLTPAVTPYGALVLPPGYAEAHGDVCGLVISLDPRGYRLSIVGSLTSRIWCKRDSQGFYQSQCLFPPGRYAITQTQGGNPLHLERLGQHGKSIFSTRG